MYCEPFISFNTYDSLPHCDHEPNFLSFEDLSRKILLNTRSSGIITNRFLACASANWARLIDTYWETVRHSHWLARDVSGLPMFREIVTNVEIRLVPHSWQHWNRRTQTLVRQTCVLKIWNKLCEIPVQKISEVVYGVKHFSETTCLRSKLRALITHTLLLFTCFRQSKEWKVANKPSGRGT